MRHVPSRFRKSLERGDLFRRGFLFGHHMIQAEDHQRIGIGENSFVDRQLLAGLVDTLINRDGIARHLAH